MSQIELKPCPFCGESARESVRSEYRVFHSGLSGCPLEGMDFRTEQWNHRSDGGDREKAARLLEAASDVGLYAQEDGHGYHCRTEDIEKLARAVEEFEK